MTDFKARAKASAVAKSKLFAQHNKGTAELRKFIRDFEKFPPDLRREMRPMLQKSGERALMRVRANAQWSSRIPAATRVSTSFTKKSAGVRLTVNRKKAPHARAYANSGGSGTFRAPTGNPPEPWVVHKARPFFFQAADLALTKGIDVKIGLIVDEVARKHGFR